MSPSVMWLILVGLLQQQTIKSNSFIGILIQTPFLNGWVFFIDYKNVFLFPKIIVNSYL